MMGAVGADRERPYPEHRRERQPGVEMREQGAAARGLVAERRAEAGAVDGNEQKIVLAAEVERRGLGHLDGGGEMDVAVGPINRRAGKDARLFRLPPERGLAKFVDRRHARSTTVSGR